MLFWEMSCCIAVFPELEASRDKIHSIITERQMLTSSVVAAAGHHTNHVPQAHKSRLAKCQRERERERERVWNG